MYLVSVVRTMKIAQSTERAIFCTEIELFPIIMLCAHKRKDTREDKGKIGLEKKWLHSFCAQYDLPLMNILS